MCVLSILMFPAMVIRYNMGWYEMLLIDVPLFFAATFSVCNFYMVCQREIHTDWRARIKYLPFLMSIGIGLSINNTRAVFEALLQQAERVHPDAEIPHRRRRRMSGSARSTARRLRCSRWSSWCSGSTSRATVFYALANQIYGTVPFLVLFQIGFLYTGLLSIVQQYAGESEVVTGLQPGRQGS